MANSVETTLSSQVYLSRDNIRSQIIDYIQYYLEIENVDLVKSSFLSFLVDTIATLTSNLMFYSSSCYKEFFLTKAQLPESIYNLSAFLGYNSAEAKYATANVLITIPFGFEEDVEFLMSDPDNPIISKRKEFKCKTASNVEFSTYYKTTVKVFNNSSATVTVVEDLTKTYNLPVIIDTTSTEPSFMFLLPVRQYKKVVQEFQIDDDIELYQFISLDVPLNGKVSTMTVEVTSPNGTRTDTYTEFQSLYLMNSNDLGYVSRTISNGRRLIFGNGLIGFQPEAGSTVKVTVDITAGEDGNVIAGSIKTGDKLYVTTSDGKTKSVRYSIINPSAASGGEDEESVEEIRANAIANIVALGRLVSEYDYKHAGVVMPNTPIASNSLPVLKRSDVKCNEVQLFSIIEFGTSERFDYVTGQTIAENIIAPTRNIQYEVLPSVIYIPRETQITVDGTTYYTLFDIDVDLINASAYYTYIMYEIEVIPVLVTSYGQTEYDLACTKLDVSKVGDTGVFELYYNSSATDYQYCKCVMSIVDTAVRVNMINDYVNKKFTYTFPNYTLFPEGNRDLEFEITLDDDTAIAKYSTEVTFRKSLNDFMMSNIVIDSTSTIIYDIPVVEKSYYDSINKKEFELTVMQRMMIAMDFKDYRMLTDFTNLKFTNTTGTCTNMKYNPVTKPDCIDISILSPPPTPLLGDRYIIGFTESGLWANKYGQIAQCTNATIPTWFYFMPITDDIVYVTDKGKKYIYNGNKWVPLEYQCPLQIELEVFKSPDYYDADVTLANLIKSTLLSEYSSRFGPNITLYRSEIIRTVQNVTGVSHCNLIKPESNIFFEYDLQTLTESELLQYSPEYIYFREADISIRVYS